MRLDKLSLQFAMHDTGFAGDVLEAYERLILDAMRGDYTLFTRGRRYRAAVGEIDAPARGGASPRPHVHTGSWGPNVIHSLIAPHAWRLPFERAWRDPNREGG